ncbi:MAG: DUF481 domain-containing protein [Gammaproteobacteria bacterium]|nr:hypothetical protein [Gammaproteobacteria bacterium]NIO62506.1 hypothetical protein [Gammaproteobacteria bacterium]NIQ10800.1 DUF481 domain-containing protein [Gammaproteobacteria bacterium]NIR27506.1 DUF481 domain-containing protein [Gammaproteobacteria bacterium]NIR94580.1 DUF481 domain-containing protein [Gammaproteobacteria bacterium]
MLVLDGLNNCIVIVEKIITELPLRKTWVWNLRFTLRHDFKNAPVPDVKKLNTVYFLSLIYDWD